ENPLGFRWVEIDSGNGFSLNGKPYRLTGTNRHQDLAGYGNALSDDQHRRDMALIKDDGFNFLRLAHYPQDPAVLRACDSLGLAVWEEIPIVNLVNPSGDFAENAERMLVEMIRQHYNHPSVLFWGYMNEVMLRKPDPLPMGYYEALGRMAGGLEMRVKQEDPGRLSAMAFSEGELADDRGLGEIPDVIGMNLYFGWYGHQPEDLAGFLSDYQQRFPERTILISEYGAGSDERIHAANPTRFDFSTEYQRYFHEENFRILRDWPSLAGTAIWNQFDFGSNHRQDSKVGINQKGLYYFDRRPKDIANFYRAHLLDSPVLHIALDDFPGKTVWLESPLPLTIYSNAPHVDIRVNGNELGSFGTENATIRQMVPLKPGRNSIVVRARFEEQVLESRKEVFLPAPPGSDSLKPDTIAINLGTENFVFTGEEIWFPGSLLRQVKGNPASGRSISTHHKITGDDRDPLFQSARTGVKSLTVPFESGRYRVALGFAEIAN
ncbi:MAG TPA: glycoside hydrolase family 2 TIM barrel-domain containing protein, partial [Calditrichia bacterium]|nr:glycoside hydrolase family 2 TIM barrel-domain containing protein [Calditrichia bacterium]